MTQGTNVVNIVDMLQQRKKSPKKPQRTEERKVLTPHQKEVMERMRARYEELKQKDGLTMNVIAEHLGLSPSRVSHSLNGIKWMGLETFLQLCRELKMHPLEADPQFEYADLIPGKLPLEAIQDAAAIAKLPDNVRIGVRKIIHP